MKKNKTVKALETAGEMKSVAVNQMANGDLVAVGDGTVVKAGRSWVKLEELRPDPNQPRKVFEPEKLEELAGSIREHGIIQDLLVEWCGPKNRLLEPDLLHDQWRVTDSTGEVVEFEGTENLAHLYAGTQNLSGYYQIIDGERRWRAAKLAGLELVPVAVRSVDAKARLALQIVANQQRENLSALEEAEAYKKELEHGHHTTETLYKALGISRGKLFSRLALNRLYEPVLTALEAGQISVSVAGLVAMVPERTRQEDLVKKLTDEKAWEYPWSFRDVQELIDEEYCKQLKEAVFDTQSIYEGQFNIGSADGKPTPHGLAYMGNCKECKYRSGNLATEFPEIKNQQVCTLPACFEAKVKAHWTLEAKKAEEAGKKVLDAAEFKRTKGQYVLEDKYEYAANRSGTFQELMGKKAPAPVLVVMPEGIKKAYVKEEAVEAAKANGVKFYAATKAAKGETAEDKAMGECGRSGYDKARPRTRSRPCGPRKQTARGSAESGATESARERLATLLVRSRTART